MLHKEEVWYTLKDPELDVRSVEILLMDHPSGLVSFEGFIWTPSTNCEPSSHPGTAQSCKDRELRTTLELPGFGDDISKSEELFHTSFNPQRLQYFNSYTEDEF